MPSRNIICLDVENIIHIFIHMETPELTPELKVMNKYLKQLFPFIVNIESISYAKSRQVISNHHAKWTVKTRVSVYVSPRHFCELMDDRVSRKLENHMVKETIQFFQSMINPDINLNTLQFIFFPDVEDITIFDGLDI